MASQDRGCCTKLLSPDLSPIVNPAVMRRIRNVVVYVPRHYSDEGKSTLPNWIVELTAWPEPTQRS
jgi:hypothetical protein